MSKQKLNFQKKKFQMKFKAMIIFLALLSILIADETTENIQQDQKEV